MNPFSPSRCAAIPISRSTGRATTASWWSPSSSCTCLTCFTSRFAGLPRPGRRPRRHTAAAWRPCGPHATPCHGRPRAELVGHLHMSGDPSVRPPDQRGQLPSRVAVGHGSKAGRPAAGRPPRAARDSGRVQRGDQRRPGVGFPRCEVAGQPGLGGADNQLLGQLVQRHLRRVAPTSAHQLRNPAVGGDRRPAPARAGGADHCRCHRSQPGHDQPRAAPRRGPDERAVPASPRNAWPRCAGHDRARQAGW